MQIYRRKLQFFRVIVDFITMIICFLFSYLMNSERVRAGVGIQTELFLFLLLSITWYVSSRSSGLYDEFRSRNFSFELILILRNVLTQVLTVIVVLFLMKEDTLSRMFVVYYSVSFALLLIAQKYLLRKILNYFRKKGRNRRSLLMIGAGEIGWKFYESIEDNPHFGYHFIGFLDDDENKKVAGEYLGKVSELRDILEGFRVDDVLIALPNRAAEKIREIVHLCNQYTTRVRIIPDYSKFTPSKSNFTISMFGAYPVIAFREEKINEFHFRLIKRLFDFLFSIFIIVTVFSWLFPLIILFIKLDDKGKAFYKQPRWGRNNRTFFAYKFRSMKMNSTDLDENGKFKQTSKSDSRVTRVGKILRKLNLDELPQFFNVLRGEMSVVGPRPHPTVLNLESRKIIDNYLKRHLVKPGITGWAQVHGLRGETKEVERMVKRVEFDIWYIENWSIWLDLQIIFMTIWVMLKGDENAY